MTMPTNGNFFTRRFPDYVDGELYKVKRRIRRGMANSIAEPNGARAVSNGRRVQPLHRVGIGANGVFRDVHGRKPVLDRELHRFLSSAFEVIDSPVFHEAADRARAEKCRGFDRNAYTL